MRSNSSRVNDTVSEVIQCPQTSSATDTPMALGTKLSVTSWIWVIDCSSETAKPMTSAVTSTGAQSLAASTRASRPMSRIAFVSMLGSSVVRADQGGDDQAPAVDEDEEQELEGQ